MNTKLEKPAAPRRPSKPQGLGAALAKVTKTAYRRRGFAMGDVLTNWNAIVGDALAAQSCPESLNFPQEKTSGGTLKVRVNGPLALELQHLAPLVIERVNGYYGFRAVERLSFIQGPIPQPERKRREPIRPLTADEEKALNALVPDLDDEDLRQSLLALGRSVLAKDGENSGKTHPPH
jgi:hypothetical protein